jgi:hypothetical protein
MTNEYMAIQIVVTDNKVYIQRMFHQPENDSLLAPPLSFSADNIVLIDAREEPQAAPTKTEG